MPTPNIGLGSQTFKIGQEANFVIFGDGFSGLDSNKNVGAVDLQENKQHIAWTVTAFKGQSDNKMKITATPNTSANFHRLLDGGDGDLTITVTNGDDESGLLSANVSYTS
jgi:hypothetical protein